MGVVCARSAQDSTDNTHNEIPQSDYNRCAHNDTQIMGNIHFFLPQSLVRQKQRPTTLETISGRNRLETLKNAKTNVLKNQNALVRIEA